MIKAIKSKGFTLIELLVVISIIAILASLAMASYGSAQKQARDTQRRSDLDQYRIALENYSASHSSVYPVLATAGDIVAGVCTSKLKTSYMSDCPKDPITTTGYQYRYYSASPGTEYVVYALLETGGYWEYCSSGKAGKNLTTEPTGGCNLP
jgi:prepilin-type N-terminal cleavage/methylation domain-containing protein